jgi:hypothetical protein
MESQQSRETLTYKPFLRHLHQVCRLAPAQKRPREKLTLDPWIMVVAITPGMINYCHRIMSIFFKMLEADQRRLQVVRKGESAEGH